MVFHKAFAYSLPRLEDILIFRQWDPIYQVIWLIGVIQPTFWPNLHLNNLGTQWTTFDIKVLIYFNQCKDSFPSNTITPHSFWSTYTVPSSNKKKWKTILPLTCHNIHFCNTQFLAYRFYYHYSSLHLTSTPFEGMSKTPSPYKYDLIKHFKVRTPANPRPQPPQKQCQFHKSLMAFTYFATNFKHDFGSKALIWT